MFTDTYVETNYSEMENDEVIGRAMFRDVKKFVEDDAISVEISEEQMDELKLMLYDKVNVDKMMYDDEQDSMIDVAVESDEVILTQENNVVIDSSKSIEDIAAEATR